MCFLWGGFSWDAKMLTLPTKTGMHEGLSIRIPYWYLKKCYTPENQHFEPKVRQSWRCLVQMIFRFQMGDFQVPVVSFRAGDDWGFASNPWSFSPFSKHHSRPSKKIHPCQTTDEAIKM